MEDGYLAGLVEILPSRSTGREVLAIESSLGVAVVGLSLTSPVVPYSGSYAEYGEVSYADVNSVNLLETVALPDAAELVYRFITAFRGLVARANVQVGERVVVFGYGGVGLEACMIKVRPQRKQLAYNSLSREVKMKILTQFGRVMNSVWKVSNHL